MKLHASIGADILSSIEFPYPVVPIVRHHHENWDGSGYPTGLSGIDIPIGARILSVVDCFDALTSDRPYRPRLSSEAATKILLDRRSSMYDPMVVDAFIKLQPVLFRRRKVDRPRPLLQLERIPRLADPRDPLPWASDFGDEVSLFRVYQILADATDRPWQDTADLVLHRLSCVIPFDSAVVLTYDSTIDELVCETVQGNSLAALKGRKLKVGQGLSGWVAAHKRTVVNSPGALDSDDGPSAILKEYLSSMSAPIMKGDNLVGVVTLYPLRPEAFMRRHAEIIEGVASHLAPILRRRRSVGQSSLLLQAGQLAAPHLDQYSRQFLERRSSNGLFLLVLRVASSIDATHWTLSHMVGEIYANLRGGDLVFVCDEHTFVCLIADGDGVSARFRRGARRQGH